MNRADQASVNYAHSSSGWVGRIPVRNLWFLQLYASEIRRLSSISEIRILEEDDNDVAELVAGILTEEVEFRLKRSLSLGYQMRSCRLSRIRGRIEFIDTEFHRLLDRGLIACRYEELNIDTPRNRFIRLALERLSTILADNETGMRCRLLARSLRQLGVTGIAPSYQQISKTRLGRHEYMDRPMLAAAKLAFQLRMPSEEAADYPWPDPDREERWIRLLFEKAVRGFYKVHLKCSDWKVRRPKLNWQIVRASPGLNAILPEMNTDIIIRNKKLGVQVLIDTKFTGIFRKNRFGDQRLKNSHIYQIYSYLRSQVNRGDELADMSRGLLLYPSIGETVDESVNIQNHLIRFATVDLAGSTKEIKQTLMKFADNWLL